MTQWYELWGTLNETFYSEQPSSQQNCKYLRGLTDISRKEYIDFNVYH